MMGSKAGTKIAEGTLAKVWGILYETRTVMDKPNAAEWVSYLSMRFDKYCSRPDPKCNACGHSLARWLITEQIMYSKVAL